ncbi:BON domain-containing protein [Propionivibrio sp.]|uniref:BON domain-containing protein n=1 Tax=Propionivibrio sp. TaxID=2212460 RepID=UPI003BEFFB98
MNKHIIAGLLLGATVLSLLQGCVPVVVAGATAGALATFDRRSLGTQTEDETIEWKSSARLGEKFGDKAHLNFTSFNRKVLLTGEVPTAEDKAEAERIVTEVPNVQGVYNEITVGPISSFSDRSNDSFITSKVKSRSVDSGKYNPVHVKVVTEAGVVFLLGMVTQPEANSAINVARTTAGVKKVVNLLEIITPAKARELDFSQSNGKQPPAEVKNP